MFKIKRSNKAQTHAGRQLAHERGELGSKSHGRTQSNQSNFLLTNILEEGSSVDEPRNFEQDEQYLNDCLNTIGCVDADVQGNEIEEYDFDDFNSIASTASLLNLASDCSYNETNRIPSPPCNPLPPRNPKQVAINGTITHPTWNSHGHYTNGHPNPLSKERVSNVQKSISKVQNWDKLGRTVNREDWEQVLLRAAESGDLITVHDAVSRLGATKESLINARDMAGNTPLHKAAQGGKLQCLQWLVKRAPAEAVAIGNNDDMTPAAMATQFGQYECLVWLVGETRAREELERVNSFTLVHYAAQAGQEQCLRYLLSYLSNADKSLDITDSNGVTPAHLAAREGHLICLQTLVEYNGDVTNKDKDGATAADYAFKAGQTGCARYLIVVESCWLLSAKVTSLQQELTECKYENLDLRQKLEVMESRSHSGLPDRPEAIGGDQSDSSSSSTSASGTQRLFRSRSKPIGMRRSNSSPDGESPKDVRKDCGVYDFQINSHVSPQLRDKQTDSNARKFSHSDALQQGSEDRSSRTGSRFGTPSRSSEVMEDSDKITQAITPQAALVTPCQGPYRQNTDPTHQVSRKTPPPPPPRTTPVSRVNLLALHSREISTDVWRDPSRRSSTATERSDSTRSTRSQSPYRSDRSTASSTGTVTQRLTPPITSKMPSRTIADGMHETGQVRSTRKESSKNGCTTSHNRGRNDTSFSSDSPFSSDSDMEHMYEKRRSFQGIIQAAAPKDGLRKIRTEEINTNIDYPLRTCKSTSQLGRLSRHEGSKTGKIASPLAYATHDVTVNNRISPGRQAQVIWNGPHGRDVERVAMGDRLTTNRVLDTSPSVALKPRLKSNSDRTCDVDCGDYADKPWYETDEIDL